LTCKSCVRNMMTSIAQICFAESLKLNGHRTWGAACHHQQRWWGNPAGLPKSHRQPAQRCWRNHGNAHARTSLRSFWWKFGRRGLSRRSRAETDSAAPP
jgi:hypothetical protein